MYDDSAWIALSLLRHVGGKTLRALVAHFGSAHQVLAASPAELRRVRGVGQQIASAIQSIDLERTRCEMLEWQAAGVTIAPRYTAAYPDILRQLDDEPPTLFIRGTLPLDEIEKAVAIVGTRNPTKRARKLAFQIAAHLARQQQVVVSGLAFGVDSAAHHGALSVRGGKTVAVLGSGVQHIYPQRNQTLAARIMLHGAVISENHPRAAPNSPRLVSRNRIISGLSEHTIVIESASDGGAMHTARAARAQGRTIHTLDLPVSGNQELLRDGAKLIPCDDLGGWSL